MPETEPNPLISPFFSASVPAHPRTGRGGWLSASALTLISIWAACTQAQATEPVKLAQAATKAAAAMQKAPTPREQEKNFLDRMDKVISPLPDYKLSDADTTKIKAAIKAASGHDDAKLKELQASIGDPV
ncbi:MAG: hypothetical protein WC829_12235, partial [Hyphomicrobium sp.]